MQSVTLQRKAAKANNANRRCVKAALSFSPLCVCRLDDLAVDSDEEVDYSKMDQVTSDISLLWKPQNLQRRFDAALQRMFVAAGGAVGGFSRTTLCWTEGMKLLSVSGEQEGSSGPLGLRHSGGVFRLHEQQGSSAKVGAFIYPLWSFWSH